MNVLDKISNNINSLSKSERKVAEVILASPQTAIHSSIATLAKMAEVSEPTVNRFCRRLETKGFPDFKLHLAQSLANGTPYVSRTIDESDDPNTYSQKIFETHLANLDSARQMLDINVVNRCVDLLTQAHRISFFGLGASAAVAHDAQGKFMRFNVPINYSDDPLLQRIACASCNEGDVMVLISHTGRTKSTVELATLARENDATVIAITASDTPLARTANLVLPLDIEEDTEMYMPMTSRIVQLAVIDVLATGFVLRRGPKFRDNLRKVKDALRSSRFEKVAH